jgi:DNA polymerase IV
LLPGKATARLSALHRTRLGLSACARPWQRRAPNGFVPDAIFVAPDFTRYRAASGNVREIFKRHTDLIEPLSLDEAYLDVTENKTGLPTATLVARTIREQIRQELNLTASAGVAPNKFLAKLASDWKKPDGLFVILLEEVDAYLIPLSVGRLSGVGKVNEEKLEKLGIKTVGELRSPERAKLEHEFGRYGVRLYELARGIPDRPTKSISVEDTFPEDVLLAETEPMIRRLAEKLWSASRKEVRIPRTVVLKLKTKEFKILTRSHTASAPPPSCDELTEIALKLREHVTLGPQQRYRLVGVGLSNFREAETIEPQPAPFESGRFSQPQLWLAAAVSSSVPSLSSFPSPRVPLCASRPSSCSRRDRQSCRNDRPKTYP